MLFFTVDEEIGKGVAHMDKDKLKADFGYTLDSGDIGSFEYENFSANGFHIDIIGNSAHPGYAKGKMENASKLASEIVSQLPSDRLSPETTSGMEGFVHPTNIKGDLQNARISFIIRDFVTENLAKHEAEVEAIAKSVLDQYPNSSYKATSKLQYRNMKDVVKEHMHIVDHAKTAMENLGIPYKLSAIRGGTDGAVLSHNGMPCPNLFSGQHGIHSKLEWTTVQEMESAVKTVVEICKLIEEKA